MATKLYKPTTPGRRGMSVLDYSSLSKVEPEKSLLAPLEKKSGRNSYGRITVRHRGCGNRRKYRIIDFKRNKLGAATVLTLEYDPNRSANIALVQYEDGEKRYIVAPVGLKVGDTITGVENPASEPLPGYRPVQPMVYSGVYPADGAKYQDMRDALEKLKLNDASFVYEPESSIALGFGFRCGFLGLLHMEIIQERLEREYNLDLITTAPNVVYRITKNDGTVLMVDNPLDYPDPMEIQLAEEPYVKVNLMAPQEYVGNIMDLATSRRGEFKDMVYLDANRVELHYDMPLNEIIYDFFDALKSRTRGYGSLDYELIGYRPSKLVKLDILLNGDIVDALSFILFAENAYPRARKICEKLKDNIPRAQFEIPVQAAIGGKIIAREAIKALRKDVLAKC